MEPSLDSLRVSGDSREVERTKGFAREYSDEIQEILRRLPREMLLLLKTNDCLRAVDKNLGAPVNTFAITARYCVRGINQHRQDVAFKNRPIRTTYVIWRDRLKVEMAILAYRLMVWWNPPPQS